MLNQATIDNIRNLNTHCTRTPKIVFDPGERRAALAASVDALCRRHGFTDPVDINAFCRLAMVNLANGHSAAHAFEVTRKSVQRLAAQLVPVPIKPRMPPVYVVDYVDVIHIDYSNQTHPA